VPKIDPTEAFVTEPPPAAPQQRAGNGEVAMWRFRLAVMQHRRIVYRVALAYLRDGHEAEDVCQETYLRYWQQGSGVRRPREWLLAVARNACLDRLRRIQRLVSDADAALELPTEERDPVWHLQQQELSARLSSVIRELPEPQRSLVILFDVHGVDGAACARILGLNANQVKVYLHRARRRLRDELERSP
jgi:RNA polymerase sigma-70 factor, ECF subfamily